MTLGNNQIHIIELDWIKINSGQDLQAVEIFNFTKFIYKHIIRIYANLYFLFLMNRTCYNHNRDLLALLGK